MKKIIKDINICDIKKALPARSVLSLRAAFVSVILAVLVSAPVFAGPDNNPLSAGSTQARNTAGFTFDAAFGNPALLGLDRSPRGSFSLLPTAFSLRSDKLAPPFNNYLFMDVNDVNRGVALYLTTLLEESFPELKNKDLTPDSVSTILTEEFRGGVNLYTGFSTSPIMFSTRGFALNVRSYADVDMTIPEGFIFPIFSATEGLVADSELDFSQFQVDAIAATEIAVKLGFSTSIPFMRNVFKLDRGAAGVGIKLILGHALFKAEADPSSKIRYNEETNKYEADIKVDITTAGTGMHGSWEFGNPIDSGVINGQGWGLDLGAVFHNDRHFFSIDVQNIGMIFWGDNTYTSTFVFQTDGADLDALVNRDGGVWPSADTLTPAGGLVTYLPTSLNVGYVYLYSFSDAAKFITSYISGSLAYEQQIVLGPGRHTYNPRFTFGAATGLLGGFFPIRYGIILGGPEELGSALGFGLDLQYVSLDASYKAIGSPLLTSKRGFEVAAALSFKGGYKKKEKKHKYKEPKHEPEPPPPEPEYVIEEPPVPEIQILPEAEPVSLAFTVTAPAHAPQPVHTPPPPPPVTPAAPAAPSVDATVIEMVNAHMRLASFNPGSAALTPEATLPSVGAVAIDSLAAMLRRDHSLRFEIQGHTDADGAESMNASLSALRAMAFKNHLIAKGVPPASIVAVGYGRTKLIGDNSTPEGRAMNRRVELAPITTQADYDRLRALEAEQQR